MWSCVSYDDASDDRDVLMDDTTAIVRTRLVTCALSGNQHVLVLAPRAGYRGTQPLAQVGWDLDPAAVDGRAVERMHDAFGRIYFREHHTGKIYHESSGWGLGGPHGP